MSILRKIFRKVNGLLRRSYWVNEVVFPDCKKFWNHNTYGLELVNLGSSSAKYGFNYDGVDIKAANWAMAPQTFVGDYAILSNYSSYLKPGATILISFCPFSSLGGGNDDLADKYYTVVRPISILHASLRRRDAVMDIKSKPLKYYPLFALIGEIKRLFGLKQQVCKDFERDANRWINSWKKEFSLYNLHDPFALINQDRFNDSVESLQKLLVFCKSHGYKAVLVLPPMTKHLSQKFDNLSRQQLIYNFIEQSNIINAPILDYIDHEKFSNDIFFRNAYLLNEKGAKEFTNTVLIDLSKL